MGDAIFGKIIIGGKIKLKTGLHIGAQTEAIEIGGIDNPILKDPITGEPYIPGSSLKGKLRSLFEKLLSAEQPEDKRGRGEDKWFNRNIGEVWIHACETREEAEKCPICRLFGISGKKRGNENHPSRTIFRDAHLVSGQNVNEIIEIKTETAIDRITSAANPRDMERVVPGTEFEFEIVYNVENEEEKREDVKNLISLMKKLEDDYLGGSGSRGYGKVELKITKVVERTKDYYLKDESEKVLLSSEKGLDPEKASRQILGAL